MPIPYTTFVDGSDLLPDHVNLLFNPVFDGQTQYLGHYAKLVDTNLDPNGVLKRVSAMTDPFKVQVETGLSVRILTGTFRTEDDALTVLADEVITLANNATTYIYKDTAGNTATNTSLPSIPKKRLLLAKVTTSSGVISDITDYRGYDQRFLTVNPRSIRLFGGSSTTNITTVDGQTIAGTIYCKTFTVPASTTLYVDKLAVINCQDFVCNGNIIVSTATDSFLPPLQAVVKSTTLPQVLGTGVGATGDPYSYTMQAYGSAGQSGSIANYDTVSNLTVQASRGGKGGGGFQVNASNTIAFNSPATLTAKGTNAAAATIYGASSSYACSGGGGGSGGTILLNALNTVTIAPGCTVNLSGGNGANAVVNGSNVARGGSGGAGGIIVATSPTLPNFTGSTITLSGGLPGTTTGTDTTATLNGGCGGGNATYGGQNGDGTAGRTGQAGVLTVSSNIPNG